MSDFKPKPIAVEVMVYTKDYAGCADFVCEINGQIFLIDFKTGTENDYSHALQLYALKKAWDELYPQNKIDKVFVYYCNNFKLPLKKSAKIYKFKEKDLDIGNDFDKFLDTYKKLNKKPKNKIYKFSTEEISIESNPDEYIKEIDIIQELIGEKDEDNTRHTK